MIYSMRVIHTIPLSLSPSGFKRMVKSETEKEKENENENEMMKMKMENGLKNPWQIDDHDDHDHDDQKLRVWPDWLPSDWYICRDIDHHPHSSSQHDVYYSNPKGKKFYSKEEVLHYLSTRPKSKKISKQIRKRKENQEEQKISVENNAPQEASQSQILTVWPDWLPDDWYIDRSYDDPTNVTYCSPKWKKFRSKDEVLHYLAAQSKKVSKQTRKRITKLKENIPTKRLVKSETVTKICQAQS